ncbi:MAG: alpha/beta fold hydrolase [Proteobacteria bacterium]|nr:alpha/beta fold hydrolase [Pseudomonadota bacterium]
MDCEPAPPAHDCVVLLHGLARSARSMRKLEACLAAQGYMVDNLSYPSRRHGIAALADMAVGGALARCRARSPRQIHFVTHSLGGVLVRHHLARHRVERLGRVVMLAPPNQGSEVVDRFGRLPGFRFINGPAGAELGTRADSVPLRLGAVDYPVGVIAGTRSINPLLSTALPSPNDGKVSVERTRVEGMSDFLCVPVSHPFIMRNDAVIEAVLRFLASGAFAPGQA